LPLSPRNEELQNVWAIQMGDALLTPANRTARGVPWRHIAIIQSPTGPLSCATLYNPQGTPGGVTRHAEMPRQLIAMSLSERSVPPRGPAWHS